MCAVSQVGEYWANSFPQRYPNYSPPIPMYPHPGAGGAAGYQVVWNPPTREEFEALKKEMQELKELLIAAKKFDEATGQPDCHVDEKVELIRKIAIMVGVDMKDVFPDNPD